jgi:hypothetical protein
MSFQFTWLTGKSKENLSQQVTWALRYTELFGKLAAPVRRSNQSVLDGRPVAYTKRIRNV